MNQSNDPIPPAASPGAHSAADRGPTTGSGDPHAYVPWSTLLAHWTHFAKAASILPPGSEGDRWRASVAPALGLHALAMALAELHRLAPADRPLALDLAQVGIDRHASALARAWSGADLPPRLAELIADAHAALASAPR
jgi:hypothetical protein